MAERGRRGFSFMTLIVIMVVAFAWAGLWKAQQIFRNQKDTLEKAIAAIKSDYTFASIVVLSDLDGKFSFLLTLYRPDGNSAGDRQMELSGSDIFLESRVAVIESGGVERAFVFPEKIYSDSVPPENGLELSSIYITNNFPQNYADPGLDRNLLRLLPELYNSDPDLKVLLKTNHSRIVLDMDASLHKAGGTTLSVGKKYLYIVHPAGGLEFEEEK